MATRFLIGRGELLTRVVPPPRRNPSDRPVYTLQQAQRALIPQFEAALEAFDRVPATALPNDVAVASMVLNPAFIARSYFPKELLREAGLEAVGSRTVKVKPRKWAKSGPPQEVATTQFFVASPVG